MAKNKTIENATFNVDYWKGRPKEEFMQAHAGTYDTHFKDYQDGQDRSQRQLSEAWDRLFSAPQQPAAPAKGATKGQEKE